MMSSVIQDVFTDVCDGDEMSYFRSNSRPLVPGKEHRRSSSLVRSSSSSHHSHKSPKYISSMTRSFNSHHVDTAQKLPTPCGTPRKSNLNKTQFNVTGKSCMEDSCEHFDAPLGFEPEGRVDIPTVFTEGSPPSYAKWAESIDNLLSDINGINLFQTFLDESGKYLLQFYFACKGFKSSEDKLKLKKDKIFKFAKHIYQKFIKSGKVQLMRHTEQQLMESLASNTNDPTVYDSALEEVKNKMQYNLYPLFLKSDIYFQYLQKALESPNSSDNSGSSNGWQPSGQETGEMQTSSSLKKVTDRTLSFSQMSSSSVKSQNDFKKSFNDQIIYKEHKEPNHGLTVLTSLQERLKLQPETHLHAEDYHSFIHKPQEDKHLSKSMHDNRLAQKYPDQFYEKLNQKLKQLKQMQDEGKFIVRHEAMSELLPLHHYKSLQSSLSSESLESLRGCLATSGIDTDADGPQSILDHHLSQTFDEVYAEKPVGYLNESQNRPALDRLANSGDESSYSKLRKYLERGFSSQENCSMTGGAFEMHNTRSNPALNSRIRNSLCDFNSFNPLPYSQQHLQPNLAQGSMHQRQINSLAAVSSNMPKSRCYERQYVSQSDSEAMDGRVTYPIGYHWHHDFGPINSRRQSMSKETCCCSQPNLHDLAGHRTMQPMNKTMVQPSLHQAYHMPSSQQQTTRGRGNHDFRSAVSTEARRTSSSSMPPPATLPPLRSQNSLVLTSNTGMISTRFNPYQGLQSKEYHIEAKPSQLSISDIKSLPCGSTVVSYFFCDEPIPYRTTLNGVNITLAQFKTYLAKKGNYRYYCMKACDDFDSGIVFEEVFNDTDILPLCGGKICAKVEKQS